VSWGIGAGTGINTALLAGSAGSATAVMINKYFALEPQA
jgi:hypothetical protein